MKWFYALLAVCLLGAAAELSWGEQIANFLSDGRIARERADIIASYRHAAETASVPRAAGADAYEIYHLDKEAPNRMAVRVRTESGEAHQFQLARARGQAGMTWSFHADNSGQLGEKQVQEIIANYYQRAEGGIVPMPASTNAIKVFPTSVSVRTVAGETKWYGLVRPLRSAGTNWGFNPR